ncbi:hypothetical protein BJ138DRAFT_1116152 [Hygrophoropsis aurantiaca]|uniref:Uncharacterized protein n=1 Tax=Hygrophoropsis aurantiaca TaxID=72124 RepID=A0ACB8A3T5_9AGAM|nr:hypothetical protein BJ138DRAFT_1116152 [Hygrophoropsis aurantiaca]
MSYASVDVNMFLPITWAQNIFLLTMQAILVIRVYALFNRSKKVLIFLATFYVLQAVAVFVTTALQFNDQALHKFVASIGTLMGSATQNINVSTSTFLHFAQDSAILPVIFDGVLLLFALWAFVRHAAEAKTLEGGWSINVLVRMLLADHLMYFVCYLTWMSLTLAMSYVTELNVSITLLDDVSNVFSALAVVAGPRMVISLRAQEYKTRGEGCGLVTLESELSTIHFGAREPPTHWQSQSVVEEGGGFRAADEDVQID